MSKKKQFKIEVNFVDGTTREDVEDAMARWHAEQVERKVNKMPADLAYQVIKEINKTKEEVEL